MKHNVIASKDRTGLFMGKPEFQIDASTGNKILEWCNDGISIEKIKEQIQNSRTVEELNSIYHKYPEWYPFLSADFINKKSSLTSTNQAVNNSLLNHNQNISNNGNFNAIKPS